VGEACLAHYTPRKAANMARDEAYKWAERKIEEIKPSEWRSGERNVYLDNLGPTELPASIQKITSLEILNLSNHLIALPESLTTLKNFRELNLSDNKLTSLPKGLNKLIQLSSLNFSTKELKNLPEWLGNLINLRSLNLRNYLKR
jgi:Leucine-rich repeat (LRR) protein